MASAMQVDEDAGALTKPATVDLNRLFDGIQFQEVEELGLAGAQPLSSVRSLPFAPTNPSRRADCGWPRVCLALQIEKYKWKEGHAIHNASTNAAASFTRGKPVGCTSDCAGKALSVELSPMEIRTFLLQVADDQAVAVASISAS